MLFFRIGRIVVLALHDGLRDGKAKEAKEMVISDAQFGELYEYLCSEPTCDHTLRYTVDWLKEHRVRDIRGTIEKIVDLGGHCDCEVLLNVTPDVWEERKDDGITGPDMIGEDEWEQFLSDLLYESGMEPS